MTTLPWQNRIVGHAEVPPADLVPNPRNWRTHPTDQQHALVGALGEVGWVAEVTVNQTTGHVVDGHHRIELALSRHEPTVPVTYVALSEDEERLVLASLDPIGAMAEAEASKLADLLEGLEPGDTALRALLDALGRESGLDTMRVGLLDPDDAPDLPEPTQVTIQPGELYALGDHRLLCGDCTNEADVARVTEGETVEVIWTDPPYGVEYQTKLSREEAVARHRRRDGLEVPHEGPSPCQALLLLLIALEYSSSTGCGRSTAPSPVRSAWPYQGRSPSASRRRICASWPRYHRAASARPSWPNGWASAARRSRSSLRISSGRAYSYAPLIRRIDGPSWCARPPERHGPNA